VSTYTRRIEASLLATGLTGLGYTVLGVGGSTLVARTTAGVAEDGTSANYGADVANWDTTWSGSIVWDAGSGTLAREAFLPDTAFGGSGGGGGTGAGDGSVRVDHAYGATPEDPIPLAYVTPGEVGIDNAIITAFLATDHAAGHVGPAYEVARVATAVGGLWAGPMFLDPEAYVLEYHKQGSYGLTTQSLTVA
jgi:hypothetical protein